MSSYISNYDAHPDVIFWQHMVPYVTRNNAILAGAERVERGETSIYPQVEARAETIWWSSLMPGMFGLQPGAGILGA